MTDEELKRMNRESDGLNIPLVDNSCAMVSILRDDERERLVKEIADEIMRRLDDPYRKKP